MVVVVDKFHSPDEFNEQSTYLGITFYLDEFSAHISVFFLSENNTQTARVNQTNANNSGLSRFFFGAAAVKERLL